MSDLTQTLLVGLAALGAGAYLVRGIVRACLPRPRPTACEHCAVADLAEAPPRPAAAPSTRREQRAH